MVQTGRGRRKHWGEGKLNEGQGEKKDQGGKLKVLFWNVAGLGKKDEGFWKYVTGFDVVGLTETWMEEEGCKRLEKWLQGGFKWEWEPAIKRKKKGRASEGMLTEVREGLKEIKKEENMKKEEEMMEWVVEIEDGEEPTEWRIVTVYSKSMKKTNEMMEERWEGENREIKLIGGDFNPRVREKGARNWEDKRNNAKRKTKDRVENQEGRILIRMTEERGWKILNGNKEGDEEGEYTFANERGASVIDYAMVEEKGWNMVRKFRVGERTEGDHMPLEIEVGKSRRRRKKKEEKKSGS